MAVRHYTDLDMMGNHILNAEVSRHIDVVLTVTGWDDRRQAIHVEGLKAEQNGVVGLSQNVSQAEREAAASADMYVCEQREGSFTIAISGNKPVCDIPITIILFD